MERSHAAIWVACATWTSLTAGGCQGTVRPAPFLDNPNLNESINEDASQGDAETTTLDAGTGLGPEPWTYDAEVPVDAGSGAPRELLATDGSGHVWALENWVEGTRPYPKDLQERESWYRERWGEDWGGARGRNILSEYIFSPGHWEWEEFAILPDAKQYALRLTGGKAGTYGQSQALVFAPNGGEEVTAVYAIVNYGFYHVDPITKSLEFIGSPTEGGLRDGLDGDARLEPTRNEFGNWATMDPVTGRLYFAQRHPDEGQVLRYVEKLLLFEENGHQHWLPAYLDHGSMYRDMEGPTGGELSPVFVDGSRARPRFSVRTLATHFDTLPSTHQWGNRVTLSPDGRRAYVEMDALWPRELNEVHAIDLWEDRDLGSIAMPANTPPRIMGDAVDSATSRYDDHIYISRHPGAGGGPGKLFRFSVNTGRLEILYDSTPIWDPAEAKQPADAQDPDRFYRAVRAELDSTADGPADAITLMFTTTCFQFQSPRTGAIVNGGWDASGLRRYHDGFVTSLVVHEQISQRGGRPEWGDDKVAAFGSLQSSPDIAPNGDLYLTSTQEERAFPGDELRIHGIRIIRLHRTDWPIEQPVNGYANHYLSPERRSALMRQYAERFVRTLAP